MSSVGSSRRSMSTESGPDRHRLTLRLDVLSMSPSSSTLSPVAREFDDEDLMVFDGHPPVLVKARELIPLREIGRGAYGHVQAMKHPQTGFVLAVKRVRCKGDEASEYALLREHRTGVSACESMVRHYGALYCEGDAWLCMELMDVSLDKFYGYLVDQGRRVPEPILRRCATTTLRVLDYMKKRLLLVHRDVKPSNILLNRNGVFKVCDYGVSGELVDSVAKTIWAGALPYMAPEKLEGPYKSAYGVKADIWSLAISLLEVATGEHPYEGVLSPFERIAAVVRKPSPRLPNYPPEKGKIWYSDDMRDFIDCCLKKNPKDRPTCEELLAHRWLVDAETTGFAQRTSTSIRKVIERILIQEQELNEKVVESDWVYFIPPEHAATTQKGLTHCN